MYRSEMFIGQRVELDRRRTYGDWQGGYEYGTVVAVSTQETPGYLEDLPLIKWDQGGLVHRCQPCWLAPARENRGAP